MSLNAKQARFTYKIAKLIVLANEELGLQVIGKELYRTPEQAALNEQKGVGIKNSVHIESLALDLYIYKEGELLWSGDEYKQLADAWKGMDPDARWGGDFLHRKDVYHYSFEHEGVM